jgi:hypothetical protein
MYYEVFRQPQRPSSPAAMERQRNSGQVERFVNRKDFKISKIFLSLK